MRLCLNLIVKNESACIERCLNSVLPYISCWSITDTGSTDNTPQLISQMLCHLPGGLRRKPFTNFAESRNEALDAALQQGCDYVLLVDADMELVAGDPEWHRDMSHDAYLLLQKAGDISYRNVRLLRKGVRARYIGATHEYLAVEGAVWAKDEAWFIDHADGSNRPGKLERDRFLLEQQYRRTVPTDTRTIYYLAQTCRDLGELARAAELYRQRAGMSNDEEAWRSSLEYSRCLKAQFRDADFVHSALSSYGRRPHRMEPLYDLARHFIDEKQYAPAIMFANIGMNMPFPSRELGIVDDYVYQWGLRELYSVAACADPVHRPNGRAICDGLALDKAVPEPVRWGARNNYAWYLDSIDRLLPTWQARQMTFAPPTGYNAMNPTITRMGDKLFGVIRAISYWIEEHGYQTVGADSSIHSRNFLIDIDPDSLNDMPIKELLPPVDLPPPRNGVRVLGMEDMRLFHWFGDLWCSATMIEQNPEARAEIVMGRINGSDALDCFRRLPSLDGQHEKNWMPVVRGDLLHFIYKCGPDTVLVDDLGREELRHPAPIAVDHFKGSSQLASVDGGWVAIIHYTTKRNNHPWVYHRFVRFDEDFHLVGVSPGFTFPVGNNDFRAGYQYVCGMCRHPDEQRFLISFTLDEAQAWLGAASISDVTNSIFPIGRA